MYLDFVQIYLDDIIVFSPSFADHLHHLEVVFQRLADYNLKTCTKESALSITPKEDQLEEPLFSFISGRFFRVEGGPKE